MAITTDPFRLALQSRQMRVTPHEDQNDDGEDGIGDIIEVKHVPRPSQHTATMIRGNNPRAKQMDCLSVKRQHSRSSSPDLLPTKKFKREDGRGSKGPTSVMRPSGDYGKANGAARPTVSERNKSGAGGARTQSTSRHISVGPRPLSNGFMGYGISDDENEVARIVSATSTARPVVAKRKPTPLPIWSTVELAPAAKGRKATVPFLQDESDEEKQDLGKQRRRSEVEKHKRLPPHPTVTNGALRGMSGLQRAAAISKAQKDTQRLASERLRMEAMSRKYPSPPGPGWTSSNDGTARKTTPVHKSTSVPKPAPSKYESTRPANARPRPRTMGLQMHAPRFKRESSLHHGEIHRSKGSKGFDHRSTPIATTDIDYIDLETTSGESGDEDVNEQDPWSASALAQMVGLGTSSKQQHSKADSTTRKPEAAAIDVKRETEAQSSSSRDEEPAAADAQSDLWEMVMAGGQSKTTSRSSIQSPAKEMATVPVTLETQSTRSGGGTPTPSHYQKSTLESNGTKRDSSAPLAIPAKVDHMPSRKATPVSSLPSKPNPAPISKSVPHQSTNGVHSAEISSPKLKLSAEAEAERQRQARLESFKAQRHGLPRAEVSKTESEHRHVLELPDMKHVEGMIGNQADTHDHVDKMPSSEADMKHQQEAPGLEQLRRQLRQAEAEKLASRAAAEAKKVANAKAQQQADTKRMAALANEARREQEVAANRSKREKEEKARLLAQEAEARRLRGAKEEERRVLVQEAEERLMVKREKEAEKERQEEAFRRRKMPSAIPAADVARKEAPRTAPLGGPTQIAASTSQPSDPQGASVFEAEKQRRIQTLKERNQRNHQAAEVEDVDAHDEVRPGQMATLNGPFSLNGAAGVQAVQKSGPQTSSLASTGLTNGQPSHHDDSKPWHIGKKIYGGGKPGLSSHSPKFAEIEALDIQLMLWRQDGPDRKEWYWMIQRCEQQFGLKRSESALKRRIREVAKKVEQVGTDPRTLRRIVAGDVEARRSLNRAISALPLQAPASKPDRTAWEPPPIEIHHTASEQASDDDYTSLFADDEPLSTKVPNTRSATPLDPRCLPQSQHEDGTLGEVTSHDIKLMRWREEGNEWRDIIEDYTDLTGTKRGEDSLRSRYRRVKPAVDGAVNAGKVDAEVVNRAFTGDADAIATINKAIHGAWPIRTQTVRDRFADAARTTTASAVPEGRKSTTSEFFTTEMTMADIQLTQWRRKHFTFATIVPMFAKMTGCKRSESTLTLRYTKVMAALADPALNRDLLVSVSKGDAEALKRLNELLLTNDEWINTNRNGKPLVAAKRVVKGSQPSIFTPLPARTALLRRQHALPVGGTARQSPSTFEATYRPQSPEFVRPLALEEPGRPTTSGKTINQACFDHYPAVVTEACVPEPETESQAEQEEESFSPEDYCHQIYEVERREITKSEMEEDVEIEQKSWIIFGHPHENKHAANAAASKQAFVAHATALNDSIHTSKWDLNSNPDPHTGLVSFTITSTEGTVQVRVKERMRTFQEHIKPSSTTSWISRTCYCVRQRTTTKAPVTEEDNAELFGTNPDSVEDVYVDDRFFTRLALANSRAIEHFVASTFVSATLHLTRRDVERNEMKKVLLGELAEEGEEARFGRVVETETGSVEVRVEEMRLQGPRNV